MISNLKKFTLIALLITATATASAGVNFGFSVGNRCPQPAVLYSPYVPAPVFYPAPCEPHLSLGFGDENFGFGLNIPLCRPEPRRVIKTVRIANPVLLDNQGKEYWRIFNNSDVTITVRTINANGTKGTAVTIFPFEDEILYRQDSFRFKVSAANGERMRGKCSRHHLTINLDDMDELYYTTK